MSNENINPIHHSTLGGVTQTAAGAAGGALKSGLSGYLKTTLATGLVVGAVAATIALTGGLGALGWGAAGTLGNAAMNFTVFGLVGGVVGAFTTGPVGGAIGSWFGGFHGGANAAERVRNEKGAANVLDAQVSAYQAQAVAAQQATTIYAPSAANNNSFPASTMNQAGSKIQADSAQNLGTINGMQLQRA